MKDKKLNILIPRTSNPLLYLIYNFLYIYNNLVDTCNIALMLFLNCEVTKFRIPPLVTQCPTSTPSGPLNV